MCGPESVINSVACMIFAAHRTGRREAYTYLKDFILEKLEVPDWPLDPMPKLPRMTPPPLPPDVTLMNNRSEPCATHENREV